MAWRFSGEDQTRRGSYSPLCGGPQSRVLRPTVFTWFDIKEEWVIVSLEVPKLFEDSTPCLVILAAAFRDLTE